MGGGLSSPIQTRYRALLSGASVSSSVYIAQHRQAFDFYRNSRSDEELSVRWDQDHPVSWSPPRHQSLLRPLCFSKEIEWTWGTLSWCLSSDDSKAASVLPDQKCQVAVAYSRNLIPSWRRSARQTTDTRRFLSILESSNSSRCLNFWYSFTIAICRGAMTCSPSLLEASWASTVFSPAGSSSSSSLTSSSSGKFGLWLGLAPCP